MLNTPIPQQRPMNNKQTPGFLQAATDMMSGGPAAAPAPTPVRSATPPALPGPLPGEEEDPNTLANTPGFRPAPAVAAAAPQAQRTPNFRTWNGPERDFNESDKQHMPGILALNSRAPQPVRQRNSV